MKKTIKNMMKIYENMKIIILILMLGISSLVYSATIESAVNGNWADNSTWVGGIVPVGGDTILINTNHKVTVVSSGNVNVSSVVHIEISGILFLENQVSIYFATNTTISILVNGTLTAQSGNAEIYVNNILQWKKNKGLIDGQTAITDYSGTLPIELIDYYIKENTFIFTTASQENIDQFVIELYNDNMNYIEELYEIPCNCLFLMEYSVLITNKDVRYLRLVEYDYDGKRVAFDFLYIQGQEKIDINKENIYYTMTGQIIRSTFNDLTPGIYIHKDKKIVKTCSEN